MILIITALKIYCYRKYISITEPSRVNFNKKKTLKALFPFSTHIIKKYYMVMMEIVLPTFKIFYLSIWIKPTLVLYAKWFHHSVNCYFRMIIKMRTHTPPWAGGLNLSCVPLFSFYYFPKTFAENPQKFRCNGKTF